MGLYHIAASVLLVTAVFSYLNHRFIHLHVTVGVMLISMAASVAAIITGHFVPRFSEAADSFIQHIPFGPVVLQWMLAFLLFAGSLTVDLDQLLAHRGITAWLATAGTILSALLIGGLAWGVSEIFHLGLSPVDATLLGAVLSPTDPVAVLGVMNRSGAPADVRNIIAAESLFNDGVGVILFLSLLAAKRASVHPSAWHITLQFVRVSLGGALLGYVAGRMSAWMLKTTLNFETAILIMAATAMGVYAASDFLDFSGPIAVVVAGLVVAVPIRRSTGGLDDDLAAFWRLIDDLFNAVLFVLIGLQVMLLSFSWAAVIAGLIMIPAVMLARAASVGAVLKSGQTFGTQLPKGLHPLLVWGGLRGGLAVAMALSIPAGRVHDVLLTVTYIVVVFSVAVQGTTINMLLRRLERTS